MKSQRRQLVILAAASAVVAFGIAAPRFAFCGMQNVMRYSCYSDDGLGHGKNFFCSFIGGDMLASGVTGAYFDYSTSSAKNVDLSLMKWSFSGSVFSDNRTIVNSSGVHDEYIAAVQSIQLPSNWDYYWGSTHNCDGFIGNALLTR